MKNNNIKGSFFLCLAALIWGLAFVAQSAAADYVPPFLTNCLRSIISAIFLYAVYKIRNRKNHAHIIPSDPAARKTVLSGGLICGIMLAISTNFQQFGIAFYPEGSAAEAHAGFITALYVILVPLFSLFIGKKPSASIWAAVAVSLIGFYLLCFSGGLDGIYLGDLLIMICAVAFSFHILSVDAFVDKLGGLRLSILQFLVCSAISGVLSLIFEFSQISLQNLITAAPQILYLGIVSSGIGYTLQIIGQRYADPSVSSLSMSLESVFAALGGWIISGNALKSNEIWGCTLVFAAIVLAQLPPIRFKKLSKA